ncbi:Fungalysin/Thermolysin Extracellular metalloproteinase 5 [Tulasnella sp. 418]|nr:Fungalysin/Thermolysin Extracellular metalloproteinase 5 [Tulasnella sp. 418]
MVRKTILAATLGAASLAAAHSGVPQRKSLSFGPQLPSKYSTSPQPHVASLTSDKPRCDHSVAKAYVKDVLGHEGEFRVREDSYKDPTTRVTHVYLRQYVNGIEVADGDININILDGKVISYGDSFYTGPTPQSIQPSSKDAQDHGYYCDQLRAALTEVYAASNDQVQLGSQPPHLSTIMKLFEHNCATRGLLDPERHNSLREDASGFSDPTVAALWFMIAAHPDAKFQQDLLENFKEHLDGIDSTMEHHLHSAFPTQTLNNVPGASGPVQANLVYVQTPVKNEDGTTTTSLNLVWKLVVDMQDNWYEAYLDATTPSRIVSVVDWVSDSPVPTVAPIPKDPEEPVSATYKVWPWGINDPQCGKRKVITDPWDKVASPYGWHTIPKKNNPTHERAGDDFKGSDEDVLHFSTTWGNNAFAQENWEGRSNFVKNYRPDAGSNMTFVYPWGASDKKHAGEKVEPKSYIDASVTQLFYTTNLVHDLYYRYGFDEVAGNFQQYNFGKGGKENDAVIANAQDGSGYNNANFATPPDGFNGRMRMYVWNTATPYRDGDLEAGIVIHELSHGLSTRLTGGPANSGCLGWGESGGMGEGWGDFLATSIRSTNTYHDFPMGSWAANQEKGIRNYIYSTNFTINPSTYKTLDKPGYWGVHAIGEVWAEILWVVNQRLIKVHGYSDTLFPPTPDADGKIKYDDFYRTPEYDSHGKMKALVPKHGNTLMFQLVLNAMKLQPCRPSFFDARDAIIQADENLTGGENACELWRGFSDRGLGKDAEIVGGTPWGGGIRTDGHSIPKGVCSSY